MEEEQLQQKKRGRPKKPAHQTPFVGFPIEQLQVYYSMPVAWMLVSAEIDNLAELKVVQYIFYHGGPSYHQLIPLTNDELMNGRKDVDGSRMDFGTGLSESAVRQGVKRAIDHGFIICDIDDTDKSNIKMFYGLNIQEEVLNKYPAEEEEVFDKRPQVFNKHPQAVNKYLENAGDEEEIELNTEEVRGIKQIPPSNKSNYLSSNTYSNVIRITPREKKEKIPDFIKSMMEDFSKDMGDEEHTGANIVQAARLFGSSGRESEQFQQVLYEARDIAKKASIKKLNSRGKPNRMPYFFKCLNQLLQNKRRTGNVS